MRIAVLGAGSVGHTLTAKLRELGHDVWIGTRNPRDGAVSYAEAAEAAQLVVNATAGAGSLEALEAAGGEVMVNPGGVPGDHVLFVYGDDGAAKAQVVELLGSFGWPSERIVDLGDITSARGTEMYVALWIRLMLTLGTHRFNITLPRA
jgi:predicted dinucleotide-binding enzyme